MLVVVIFGVNVGLKNNALAGKIKGLEYPLASLIHFPFLLLLLFLSFLLFLSTLFLS